MQTLRGNDSRIHRVKNTKFSGYCFYMNKKIYWDFQICVSVPLISNSEQTILLKRRSRELLLLGCINFEHFLSIPPETIRNLKVFLVLKGNIGTKWVNVIMRSLPWSMSLYEKGSFPLRISSVNVTRFPVSCAVIMSD